jgi:hypothetical protein
MTYKDSTLSTKQSQNKNRTSKIWLQCINRIIIELTSFDEVRRAEASIELLCNKALIFLKEATTDIGTALSENVNQCHI